MKKILLNKKVLFTLGAILPLSMVGIASSCGVKNFSEPKNTVSNIETLVKDNKTSIETASKDDAKHNKLKIQLLTAAGAVNDQSFNQSIWEALQSFGYLAGLTTSEVKYTNSPSQDRLHDFYDRMLKSDSNVWVLSGFNHGLPENSFVDWYAKPENKGKFDAKNITVVGIDFNLDESKIAPGKFITIKYRTNEAGWIAGYAASKFLADIETEVSKRTLATFGGGNEAGVTDFIAGFLGGINYWNTNNSDKKVKLSHNALTLDTGFDTGKSEKTNAVKSIVTTNNPRIILPVAGPFTATVLESMGESQYVIGVDTDQSKAFKDKSAKFFTSIEKRLGDTLFRVIRDLYLKDKASDTLITGFEKGVKSLNIFSGRSDKAVSVSENSFGEGDNKTKADAALAEAKDKFTTLTNGKTTAKDIADALGTPYMHEGSTNDQVSHLNYFVKKINGLDITEEEKTKWEKTTPDKKEENKDEKLHGDDPNAGSDSNNDTSTEVKPQDTEKPKEDKSNKDANAENSTGDVGSDTKTQKGDTTEDNNKSESGSSDKTSSDTTKDMAQPDTTEQTGNDKVNTTPNTEGTESRESGSSSGNSDNTGDKANTSEETQTTETGSSDKTSSDTTKDMAQPDTTEQTGNDKVNTTPNTEGTESTESGSSGGNSDNTGDKANTSEETQTTETGSGNDTTEQATPQT
ncbi:BMP family ABC transporter substrate-binding protein [Mesomycoplasma neurolyticum]|uniref:ABC transporter substrate-binding protein PnrA-like domain-containing protein n=1 Tax=Mesomycoplasma neurolyticum TaxID=2120 RepID=A0A449A6A8_9BACT|nr:BMP family ABC transporter substrate-binding protein [Mesomycoplasma neurolyticum]VEU59759.1 Uncharacterised protein [Mesomycoplasma neurolyticum]